METIINLFQQSLDWTVPFIVLLGILIFVHELGHFLVAKYYGVRVEVFSLGFGKKIFQFKRDSTTYCVSLIPLGGYVKMFGDDLSMSVEPDQQKFAFLHKPVYQRIAIVLAGPLMNFVFAIFVFAVVALIGENIVGPQVGDVEFSSEAYELGFRSGDQIQAVGDKSVKNWNQFKEILQNSAGQKINILVKRETTDNQRKLTLTPKLVDNENVLSRRPKIGDVKGLSYLSKASLIGVSPPNSLAALAGMKTGDLITSISGRPIKYWRELETVLSSLDEQSSLEINYKREDKELSAKIALPPADQATEQRSVLGIIKPDLFLARVISDSPAEQAGLKKGDHLVKIDNTDLKGWKDLVKRVSSFKTGDPPLNVFLMRDGEAHTLPMSPTLSTVSTRQGGEEERFTIGIQPFIAHAIPSMVIKRTRNPIKAFWVGVVDSWKWSEMTMLTFVRIFQNRISAKNIGGVISIAHIAKQTFEIGIAPFLKIMGIISINLFILNLLPIPILDGGHLLFFSIEALRGAPISMRKLEIAQQVGLVVILGLIAFALMNDVSRLISF